MWDRHRLRLKVSATQRRPPVKLRPSASLRLAAAAKLPPLLIYRRATMQSRGERRQKGVLGRGGLGLERWIWMLVKGSQTVRIKENQWAARLRKVSGIKAWKAVFCSMLSSKIQAAAPVQVWEETLFPRNKICFKIDKCKVCEPYRIFQRDQHPLIEGQGS